MSKPTPEQRAEPQIERILRRVAELPDRTSPDDWPEAMLVTQEELELILLEELQPAPEPPKDLTERRDLPTNQAEDRERPDRFRGLCLKHFMDGPVEKVCMSGEGHPGGHQPYMIAPAEDRELKRLLVSPATANSTSGNQWVTSTQPELPTRVVPSGGDSGQLAEDREPKRLRRCDDEWCEMKHDDPCPNAPLAHNPFPAEDRDEEAEKLAREIDDLLCNCSDGQHRLGFIHLHLGVVAALITAFAKPLREEIEEKRSRINSLGEKNTRIRQRLDAALGVTPEERQETTHQAGVESAITLLLSRLETAEAMQRKLDIEITNMKHERDAAEAALREMREAYHLLASDLAPGGGPQQAYSELHALRGALRKAEEELARLREMAEGHPTMCCGQCDAAIKKAEKEARGWEENYRNSYKERVRLERELRTVLRQRDDPRGGGM